ncbi:stage V sporulation protein K [Thecamonas trahens ATCC 50062]|uniref:Stage V sporulation protein K n=1 Tax=Thecamonas trahens ATCC 50062 TaxID=461836 RepID=A0A0L0D438_THETB|nr:stage V sporulation protein K [Thecamonas trahens ATCC 50062]KNC47069.1 stage V sporulation protein K [Thecamonas trahens ATCC 50062]|eukprot:XP_013759849.1 stage V sporulation protein K [Thecamonas trahens ATCC 50062]
MWKVTLHAHDSETNVHQPPQLFWVKPGKMYKAGRVDCDVLIDDGSVSRHHLNLRATESPVAEDPPLLTLEDVSRYGTFLNKRRVQSQAETLLQDGDVITLGDGETKLIIGYSAKGMVEAGPAPGSRPTSHVGAGGADPSRAGPSQIEVLRARRNNLENGAPPPAAASKPDGPSPSGSTVTVDAEEYEKLKKDNASIYKQFLEMEKQHRVESKAKAELQALVALHNISLVSTNSDEATTKDLFHGMLHSAVEYLAEKNPKTASTVVEALVAQLPDALRENNTTAASHTLETLLALKARAVAGFDDAFVAGAGIESMLGLLADASAIEELQVLAGNMLSILTASIKALQRIRAWPGLAALRETHAAADASDPVAVLLTQVFEKVDNGPRDEISEYLESQLAQIVGLSQVKEQMRRMLKAIRLNERRRLAGVTVTAKADHHMVLIGNPGTGKTTVARLLAALFFKIGLISRDVFVEVSREDLVAGYIGQTAIQTKAVIQRAAGGVLFIDEAYRLSSGGKKDFGKEAIETLMTEMTRQNPGDERIIFIFAGYADEMTEFKSVNPGLSRRISYTFDFADYSVDELVQIVIQKVASKNFKLAPGVETELAPIISSAFSPTERSKHNGGLSSRLVDNAIEHLNMRLDLDSGSIDTLVTLTTDDFAQGAVKLKEAWWG